MVHHLKAKALAVLAFGVVVTIIFLFFFVGADGKLPFRPEPYTARVILPNAFQLVTNSDVRLSGLQIGSVSSITNRGSNALVEFEVEDEHAPLYRDATVQLRTKSLLGENYLDIERGDPRSGALEPRIRRSRSSRSRSRRRSTRSSRRSTIARERASRTPSTSSAAASTVAGVTSTVCWPPPSRRRSRAVG